MTIWRWAALAALGVIACLVGFSNIPGIGSCGGSGDPILAFEFVRSPAEVSALFPPSCRAEAVAAQRNGLLLDGLAFIPIYSAFLILSLVAVRREGRGDKVAGVAIVAVIVAAVFDQFEGLQLWRILSGFPGTDDMVTLLMSAVRGKFALLSLAVIVIGWLHLRVGGWRMASGAVMILASLWSLVGLVSDYHRVSEGSGIAWLILIATTFALALRKAPA